MLSGMMQGWCQESCLWNQCACSVFDVSTVNRAYAKWYDATIMSVYLSSFRFVDLQSSHNDSHCQIECQSRKKSGCGSIFSWLNSLGPPALQLARWRPLSSLLAPAVRCKAGTHKTSRLWHHHAARAMALHAQAKPPGSRFPKTTQKAWEESLHPSLISCMISHYHLFGRSVLGFR